MSKSAELIKNTLILGIGRFSSQFIGLALLPIYTSFLNPAEYGLVDLVTICITLVVPAITLQTEMAAFRFLIDVRGEEHKRSRVITNIAALATMSVIPWLVIFIILGVAFNFSYTAHVVFLGLASMIFNVSAQIARGLGNIRLYAVSSVIASLSVLSGTVIFVVFMKMKSDGVLLALAMGSFVAASFLVIRIQLWRYLKWNDLDRGLQKEILGYSIPLVPNGASWWLINASGRTIVSIFLGTAANGLYAVASKFSLILTSVYSVFSMAWMESASLYINDPDRDRFFSRVMNSTIRIFGASGLILISVVPIIFPFLIGEEFAEALQYIPVMILGAFFHIVVGVYSAVYVAKRLTVKVMNTSLVAGVVNLTLTLVFVPIFGLWAAIVATPIAFLTMAIYRHYDVKKYLTISYQKLPFGVLVALSIVVSYLYYSDGIWSDYVGFLTAVIGGFILNRKDLKYFALLCRRRLKQ